MFRTFVLASLSVAGVLGLASPGEADVVVQAPFVRVQVGPGVHVCAPFVNLHLPGACSLCSYAVPAVADLGPPALPTPKPLPTDPIPGILPGNGNGVLPPPGAVHPMTLREFADHFHGGAGNYEVLLI